MPLYDLTGQRPEGLIVVGAGQTSEVLKFYISKEYGDDFPMVSTLTDDHLHLGNLSSNSSILPMSECLSKFPKFGWMVAISYQSRNVARGKVFSQLVSENQRICSYWHPKASIWSREILQPNQVMLENVVVQYGASVGANTFLWSGAHIGHHSTLGNDCFVASGSTISGSTSIGSNAFLGVNSFVADGVTAGRFLYVGAGAGLVADCGDFGLITGLDSHLQ